MPVETCWTLINGAAKGGESERVEFVRRYLPVVKAYVRRRWQRSPLLDDADDAVQEVFVECFRHGGALEHARRGQGAGFRAFLFGVALNVTRRTETRRARRKDAPAEQSFHPDALKAEEDAASQAFDRAWAKSLIAEARELHRKQANGAGEDAKRRRELLKLHGEDGRPIREIAVEWGVDAARLHHDYARARREFKAALLEVVKFHSPGPAADAERECDRLLEALGSSNDE